MDVQFFILNFVVKFLLRMPISRPASIAIFCYYLPRYKSSFRPRSYSHNFFLLVIVNDVMVPMQGGTGFAGIGVELKATVTGAVMADAEYTCTQNTLWNDTVQ